MQTYDTIIFDLDGTLLDTLEDLADSLNHALISHNYPTLTYSEIRSLVGHGVQQLITDALPKTVDHETIIQVLDTFKAYYAQHTQVKTMPYPGIIDLLNTLKTKGYKMAIVSNKYQEAVSELAIYHFEDVIPLAIGARMDMPKKPAPDSLFLATKALGSDPKKTVYVGDSEVDIQTARNAGIDCIAVSWGFRDAKLLMAHNPKHLVHTTKALLELL